MNSFLFYFAWLSNVAMAAGILAVIFGMAAGVAAVIFVSESSERAPNARTVATARFALIFSLTIALLCAAIATVPSPERLSLAEIHDTKLEK